MHPSTAQSGAMQAAAQPPLPLLLLLSAASAAAHGGAEMCASGLSAPVVFAEGSGARMCCPPDCRRCGGEQCAWPCCTKPTAAQLPRGVPTEALNVPRCRFEQQTACVYYTGAGAWSSGRIAAELAPGNVQRTRAVRKLIEAARAKAGPYSRQQMWTLFGSNVHPQGPRSCRRMPLPKERIKVSPDPPHPQVSLTGSPTDCTAPAGLRSYSQSREDVALYHRYFCRRCHGTFVELGALDGVRFSNTLMFEKHFGWKGVLIEANPEQAEGLHALPDRRSSTKFSPMGICGANSSRKLLYNGGVGAAAGYVGPISNRGKPGWESAKEIPCRPVGELIRKAGLKHVDLFSLDVEGAELEVLQTMDWSIPVRVFVIESAPENAHNLRRIRRLMQSRGYQRAKWDLSLYCCPDCWCSNNEVFENTRLVQLGAAS
eukprot:TRINITY_DN6065_c2_g1_i1.p1 TRINITY_DN6065_c2_g1~~TRINITY_DN6065_c2_g1_i1.p1  ORF type:complete len:429 (+),score=103.50 TRINITY_DN6065_c2_g1_i1:70-1356(+)